MEMLKIWEVFELRRISSRCLDIVF